MPREDIHELSANLDLKNWVMQTLKPKTRSDNSREHMGKAFNTVRIKASILNLLPEQVVKILTARREIWSKLVPIRGLFRRWRRDPVPNVMDQEVQSVPKEQRRRRAENPSSKSWLWTVHFVSALCSLQALESRAGD